MEENVTLIAAFAAGLLSFISGLSLDEMRGSAPLTGGGGTAVAVAAVPARRRALIASIAFCIGFSLVFVSLGASASMVGQFLMAKLSLLGRIAGAIIIVFGLHTMGVLKIGWLYSEKRFQTSRKPAGIVGAMLVGIAFAFGWTPCIGPILAGILAVAATQETIGHGVRLLAIYSLGLAVPFILTSLAINRFFAAFARIRRHYHKIEFASGALLVVIGVLIFTNRFTIIARLLTPYLPVY